MGLVHENLRCKELQKLKLVALFASDTAKTPLDFPVSLSEESWGVQDE